MKSTRRAFLKIAPAGALLPSLSLWPGLLSAGSTPTITDRYFVFAYFSGGWDCLLGLDPRDPDIFTPGMVRPKYFNGETTFPFGFVTIDDRWDNYWRNGPNANLGWRAAESGGFGPKGLGTEIAMSRAFSECKVEQVFERICLRTPRDPAERAEVARIADVFEAQNYSMRRVFAEVSGYCRGQ